MVHKPRLLVVEDQVDLRDLLELYLTSAGFEVESATGAIQAFEKARLSPPDAMVADLAMPGMDGAQLCAKLRADPEVPAFPVLIYSGIPAADPRVIAALKLPRIAYEPKGTLRHLADVLTDLLARVNDSQPVSK